VTGIHQRWRVDPASINLDWSLAVVKNTPPRSEMTASPLNPLPATGFRLGAPSWAAMVTGR
jgi:hypothetical protein